jgi:hypothetical protein
MGMILSLIRVSSEELNSFLENSNLLEEKFYAEESIDADWNVDLGKDWDGVQYLLSGKGSFHLKEPLNPIDKSMFTFKLIDPEQDLGYGPAQYLTSAEVKETSVALNSVTHNDFSNRFNADEMDRQSVYPGGWTHMDAKEYLLNSLNKLIKFYSEAAENNEAVITIMN